MKDLKPSNDYKLHYFLRLYNINYLTRFFKKKKIFANYISPETSKIKKKTIRYLLNEFINWLIFSLIQYKLSFVSNDVNKPSN